MEFYRLARHTGNLFVLGFLLSANVYAMEKGTEKSVQNADSGVAYVWYESGQKKTVYMSTSLVAEFPAVDSKSTMVQKAFPRAEMVDNKVRGITIWKIDAKDVATAITAVKNVDASTQLSPVYYDENTGQRRALPGGVLIEFLASVDETQAQSWIREHGYVVVSVTGYEKKYYLISTEPGQESLDMANTIRTAEVVKNASPNWWVEFFPR